MSIVMRTDSYFDLWLSTVESSLPPEGHALVKKGDIAYNMMRLWQGVLGRAVFDCLVSPAYVVMKPGPKIDSRFAEYLFRHASSIQTFFTNYSQGVVDDRLRLYPHDLIRIRVPVPHSIEEQEQIAEKTCEIMTQRDPSAGAPSICWKLRKMRDGLINDLLAGDASVAVPHLEAVAHV